MRSAERASQTGAPYRSSTSRTPPRSMSSPARVPPAMRISVSPRFPSSSAKRTPGNALADHLLPARRDCARVARPRASLPTTLSGALRCSHSGPAHRHEPGGRGSLRETIAPPMSAGWRWTSAMSSNATSNTSRIPSAPARSTRGGEIVELDHQHVPAVAPRWSSSAAGGGARSQRRDDLEERVPEREHRIAQPEVLDARIGVGLAEPEPGAQSARRPARARARRSRPGGAVAVPSSRPKPLENGESVLADEARETLARARTSAPRPAARRASARAAPRPGLQTAGADGDCDQHLAAADERARVRPGIEGLVGAADQTSRAGARAARAAATSRAASSSRRSAAIRPSAGGASPDTNPIRRDGGCRDRRARGTGARRPGRYRGSPARSASARAGRARRARRAAATRAVNGSKSARNSRVRVERPAEALDRRLPLGVRLDPVRVALGLAQRLLHVGLDPLAPRSATRRRASGR